MGDIEVKSEMERIRYVKERRRKIVKSAQGNSIRSHLLTLKPPQSQ